MRNTEEDSLIKDHREARRLLYSDMRKQLDGFRPIACTLNWVDSMSDSQFDKHWDALVTELDEQAIRKFMNL